MLQSLVGNHLLAALPSEVFECIHPALAYLTLALGDIVYEPGERMDYVYSRQTQSSR